MDSAQIVSVIAVLISAVSVILATYFNSKSTKHTDVGEIERKAAENAKTNVKLDEVIASVNDIKYDISATRKDVQNLAVDVAGLQSSYKSEHKRIDRLERVLDLKREELDDYEDSTKG